MILRLVFQGITDRVIVFLCLSLSCVLMLKFEVELLVGVVEVLDDFLQFANLKVQ